MNTSLAERYTYGVGSSQLQFNDGELVGASADFFYGIPERQKEMIGLMQTQIKLQKTATDDIVGSNIASAEIIASEIEEQTSAMEYAVKTSADRVLYKLEDLEDSICGELSKVSWELAQIGNILSKKLSDIITILKSPRKTEASELTQQGVRHLANNEISEAEDRLMKALEKDTTDYVTLMNLGFLYVQKNQADDAIKFFNKAITLSPNIDDHQKSYTLWCISRVLYATSQYKECCRIAQESVNLDTTPKKIYSLGVYKIIAGYKSEGFELLNKAISQDVSFFALTATDPDLKEYKNDVLAFLDKIYQQKYKEAKNKFQELKDFLSSVSTTIKNLSSVPPSVDIAKSTYKRCEMLLAKPIYSNIIDALVILNSIRIPSIEYEIKRCIEKELWEEEIERKKESLEAEIKTLEAEIETITHNGSLLNAEAMSLVEEKNMANNNISNRAGSHRLGVGFISSLLFFISAGNAVTLPTNHEDYFFSIIFFLAIAVISLFIALYSFGNWVYSFREESRLKQIDKQLEKNNSSLRENYTVLCTEEKKLENLKNDKRSLKNLLFNN
ncbi:MAG: hypothetical protein BWK75_05875 [Candidatus Altiarchaeales archaeon A3]|nr:MAG: hypothetical protein BWK75_05875 [Candidatus Altiarchaeales archaeon A3]